MIFCLKGEIILLLSWSHCVYFAIINSNFFFGHWFTFVDEEVFFLEEQDEDLERGWLDNNWDISLVKMRHKELIEIWLRKELTHVWKDLLENSEREVIVCSVSDVLISVSILEKILVK